MGANGPSRLPCLGCGASDYTAYVLSDGHVTNCDRCAPRTSEPIADARDQPTFADALTEAVAIAARAWRNWSRPT